MKQLSSLLKKIFSGPAPQQDGPEIFFAPRPRIALVASIAWTLWNYRLSLIQALETAGYEVVLLAAEDDTCEKLSAQTGARFVPLRRLSRQSLSPLLHCKFFFELLRLFRRHRPKLVLLFTARPNTLGNFAAALLGIPAISTIEGMGAAGHARSWPARVTRLLYRWAFRFSKKVIFLNADDRQEFASKGIVAVEKTQLVPGPGVDLTYFVPVKDLANEEKTVFLFSGRLLTEKGILQYVEAARWLKQRGLAVACRIAGRTDPGNPATIGERELQSWIREGWVEYTGFWEDVRPALAAADVLVLPSYYREGVPRAVLEAMGMAKPIITTDSIGCRETVEDGKNGFLVPPRDTAALAAAMEKMALSSREQRAAMGAYSRQKALAEFGDERVLPLYLNCVRAMIEG